MTLNLLSGPPAAWLQPQRRATAPATESTTTGPSLLWLLFLIPLVLAFLVLLALALCIARRRRRAKSRRSVLRNVSLVQEEAREKAQREARRSTSNSPGALVKRAASNGSSYIGGRVGRMTSLRSSRSGHAGHTTGGNTTVAPSSQGHGTTGGGHARFGSSSSEKSKDPFKDLESGPTSIMTHVLPSVPTATANPQRHSARSRSSRSQSGDSEKVWRMVGSPESSEGLSTNTAATAVKFEDGFAVPALPTPPAAHVDITDRPTRPGQGGRRKELSVIGESNSNSPELGQSGNVEEKSGATPAVAAVGLGASVAAGASLARRLSNRLRPGSSSSGNVSASSRNEAPSKPVISAPSTPVPTNDSSTTVNAAQANVGKRVISDSDEASASRAALRRVPPPIPSEADDQLSIPTTLLSRARSAPNKLRRGAPGSGPGGAGRAPSAANKKGLEGTSWAYTSRAKEWRAVSTGAAPGNASSGDKSNDAPPAWYKEENESSILPRTTSASASVLVDGNALSRSRSLDHRLVGATGLGGAGAGGGAEGIMRRPSIGVAGSRFRERFDDED